MIVKFKEIFLYVNLEKKKKKKKIEIKKKGNFKILNPFIYLRSTGEEMLFLSGWAIFE